MLVSSYSTYIQTTSSGQTSPKQISKHLSSSDNFASKLSQRLQISQTEHTNVAINNNLSQKTFHAKQKLQNSQTKEYQQTQKNLNTFDGKNTLLNAKSAYEVNSKMFSLIQAPRTPLKQTPSIEKTLPKEPKEIKELNIRYKMLSTYIANDNYYKITA
ncbi:MAG: hypothetical protein JKY28_00135 [Sulfurimonas sp.]|nr:hypothetical protein [Sulfurimonas sp.]PHQ92820.1 MAG: hypothetical protein COB42_00335 [Sulfurimonas sp.]